jgi:hypothetical protein
VIIGKVILRGDIVKIDVAPEQVLVGVMIFYCNTCHFLSSNARFDQVNRLLIVAGDSRCASGSGKGSGSIYHVAM